MGELFRLTSSNSNQVIVKGSNTYVGADLYHEGCSHEYSAAEDSSIVVISATKMCPPWTDTAKIPILLIKPKFSGFFYFESALAACKPHPHEHACMFVADAMLAQKGLLQLRCVPACLLADGPMGVTGGAGGTGDMLLVGESFFVEPELVVPATGGARLSVIASTIATTNSLCQPANKTFPNGGRPQCIFEDRLPATWGADGLSTAMGLASLAHDWLRALGQVDLAVNYKELK